jgi:hypothetical protein
MAARLGDTAQMAIERYSRRKRPGRVVRVSVLSLDQMRWLAIAARMPMT